MIKTTSLRMYVCETRLLVIETEIIIYRDPEPVPDSRRRVKEADPEINGLYVPSPMTFLHFSKIRRASIPRRIRAEQTSDFTVNIKL